MNKKNNKVVSQWFIMIIAFLITLIAIISGSKFQTGHKIEENSISKERFKAPRDVENRIATEKKESEAYNSVLIVFNKNEEIEAKVYAKLESFFLETSLIRGEYSQVSTKLENTKIELENIKTAETIDNDLIDKKSSEIIKHENAMKALLDEKKFSIYLPEKLRQFLVELSEENYADIQVNLTDILTNIYELGIKDDDNFNNSLVKVKNEISLVFTDSTTESLAYALTSEVLEPNLLADMDATEKARQQKVSEVEHVKYLKGQLIVDEGQMITTEIYETLNDLGFVQKDYEDLLLFILGAIALVGAIFILIYIYIKTYPSKKLKNTNDYAMLCTIYSLAIIFIWVIGTYFKTYHFAIPILVFTLLIAILFSSRLAIVMNIGFATLAIFIVNIDFNTYIYFVLSGIFISLTTKNLLEKRNKIIINAVLVGLATSIILLGILLFTSKNEWTIVLQNIMFIFANGFFSVIVAMGTLPIWEVLFGAETTIKLLELTNPDHELLTRLTIEAPGTYHHSLIVSNLAEAAAKDIGANAVWVRVGGYYHDIGKLINPANYSENIVGENPHDSLDPYESVRIIKEHVSHGLVLAEKHKLPQIIRDMIATHHGNTLVKFFYDKALKDENYTDVKEEDFRYEYSIPQYKEAGILMLADTVEAAVRSMIQNVESMDKVEAFIEKLVSEKIDDGQLQDSQMTLKDIDLTKKAFVKVFKGMHHGRIAYPSNDDIDAFKKVSNVIIENKSGSKIRSADKELINKAVYGTLKEEKLKYDIEVGVMIVTNQEIKKLNNEHRKIDEVTDVLSFPLLDPASIEEEFAKEEKVYVGDIVIAIDKVKEQSDDYGHSFERELCFLVTHSMLHLLGYDHENEEDEVVMFAKQNKILDKAGIKR